MTGIAEESEREKGIYVNKLSGKEEVIVVVVVVIVTLYV